MLVQLGFTSLVHSALHDSLSNADWAGKLLVPAGPSGNGNIAQVLLKQPQRFHAVYSENFLDAPDIRFKYFTEQVSTWTYVFEFCQLSTLASLIWSPTKILISNVDNAAIARKTSEESSNIYPELFRLHQSSQLVSPARHQCCLSLRVFIIFLHLEF